jgi:hypothetical protein
MPERGEERALSAVKKVDRYGKASRNNERI